MDMKDIIAAGKKKAEEAGILRQPGQTHTPPGLLQKARNYIEDTARHIRHGLPTVTAKEQERRLSICRGCKDFYLPEQDTCTHPKCGCKMKKKSVRAMSRCPLGLW